MTGIWLAASALFGRPVPVSQPYPCVCGTEMGCERKRNPTHCWCWGRTGNLSHLPRRCCAVRAAARARMSR